MTFPVDYARVWVRGRFVDLGKAARNETNVGLAKPVVFQPSPKVLISASAKQIIGTSRFLVTPRVSDGYFQVELPTTDDPDINPSGWTYSVVEPTGRTYNIVVPANTPALNSPGDDLHGFPVMELSSVVPAPGAQPGNVQIITTSTPADGSVTNAKVAADAAINADKLTEGSTNKLLTPAERTKLSGISAGATANASDANLRDRATHTGTQPASTISNFNPSVQALIDANGSGVPAGYDVVWVTTGDDSNLLSALASAPAEAVVVAVKVAGT